MSAGNKVSNFVLLPELILEKSYYVTGGHQIFSLCEKRNAGILPSLCV
ncbi:MAG: hypothetical protein HRT44_12860 [Bdellovibrionales bacterium]|nr:hypothetical protein [Bdellovibrionales bacterium]